MAELTTVDLRNLSDEELVEKLRESKEELFNLRFQGATGQLESHGRLRTVRKDIARIYTIMRERELGITPGWCRMSNTKDAMSAEARGERKVREGIITSNKMNKTVVVSVEDKYRHPVYGKIVNRRAKLTAHDENNTCGVGDRVLVMETRPLSATKRWRVVEILEKAK